MVRAHEGLEGAPHAPETGSGEFRRLARRYNELLDALGSERRQSDAQAARLALEERARGLERVALAEETAATFAHEIGTPLNTISGHLQLLRDDPRPGEGTRGRTREHGAFPGRRVSTIVRERLAQGHWPTFEIREADLSELSRRLVSFMEPSARQAGVRTEVAANGAARCCCDPVLVEQILLNLMKNAIEAMPEGGVLRLSTGTTSDLAWLDVADTGPGLPAAARARLFQPFVTTKGDEGTGLGLAVSQRLAQAMGGNLELRDSQKGTAWRLSLPAANGNGASA
jgi:signal transduction histidine kinase